MATTADHDRVLAKVREICLSFPAVSERLSHGSKVDWDEVRAILSDAYRKVAPKPS